MGISPSECKHHITIGIAGGRHISTEEHSIYNVWLCKKCGQFNIFIFKNGQYETVTFELATPEMLEAAGQYMKWLEEVNEP